MLHISNSKLMYFIGWTLVLAWAVALGAKIFDICVVATAWGASPPESFNLLPYGSKYPIDPGAFFQPLSGLLLLAHVCVLALGWRSSIRGTLLVPFGSLLVIWLFTPTVFWPMITELWEIHRGRLQATQVEAASLVHRWFFWDVARILVIGVGFVSSVRMLIQLYQQKLGSEIQHRLSKA